jgi:hypothetical protein
MNRFPSFVLALVATATIIAQAYGEDFWIKSSSTPILTVSDDPARFDPGYVVEPRIVYDDDTNTYFMFYTGATVDDRPNRESIGLATARSLRGPWTKYDSANDRHALFPPGREGDYDYDRNWGQGTILKTGPHCWQMWTIGDSDPSRAHVARVGYATSDNGYLWTKYRGNKHGGAVLEDFSAGSGIIEIAVIKEGDSYHAWYFWYARNTIRYATSGNGIDWTKRQTVLQGPQFESLGNVVRHGDAYYMTITRAHLKGCDIYTSTNKTDWKLLDGASLRPSAKGWDSARAYYPFLFAASANDWYLFYTGASVPDDTQGRIGYAHAHRSSGTCHPNCLDSTLLSHILE